MPVALTRLFDGRDPQALDLAKLADLVKPEAIARHAWLVSGGCARPQDDTVFRTGSLPEELQPTGDADEDERQRAAVEAEAAAGSNARVVPVGGV